MGRGERNPPRPTFSRVKPGSLLYPVIEQFRHTLEPSASPLWNSRTEAKAPLCGSQLTLPGSPARTAKAGRGYGSGSRFSL